MNGQFEIGHTPWNKGLYGYMGANTTSFTKERAESLGKQGEGKPREGHGHLICSCSERRSVKQKNGKVYQVRKRIPYARYVLEKHGIDVPRGHVVYHIDGDYKNNDISNLEVISRAELVKRNRKL